jgi:hypothetical protein
MKLKAKSCPAFQQHEQWQPGKGEKLESRSGPSLSATPGIEKNL